jgi:hypothetical protein
VARRSGREVTVRLGAACRRRLVIVALNQAPQGKGVMSHTYNCHPLAHKEKAHEALETGTPAK